MITFCRFQFATQNELLRTFCILETIESFQIREFLFVKGV